MASQNSNIFQKAFHGDKAFMHANDPFTVNRKNAGAVRKTAIRIAVGDLDDLQRSY